jgi:hypothetical protein
MTFPYACARLKDYFYPLGFEAVLDSPVSMTARVFDTKTGENFAVVAGLQWSASTTDKDLLAIIDAIDEEIRLQEFVHTPLSSDSRVGD